jgi:hypothetical protein
MAYNWSAGLQGALGGGAAGSAFGPWGSILGEGLGLLGGFGGREGGMERYDTLTKPQQGLLNQTIGQLGPQGQLGGGYGQSLGLLQSYLNPSSQAHENFADPYMRQFNQETIPGLAERFAGQGAMGGALSSSGFGQALGSAGANLQSQLASLRTGLQQQASNQLMNQYNQMLGVGLGTPSFAYGRRESEPGLTAQWASQGYPGLQNLTSGWENALVNYGPGGV